MGVSQQPVTFQVSSWFKHRKLESHLPGYGVQSIHNHSFYLAAEHSNYFRKNLLNGTYYITAAPVGGFSNQVMSQINMLYVAIITRRIPIVPDFPPYLLPNPGYLPMSEVFDLPRLAEALQIPILEWSEIKERRSTVSEEIGCWSLSTTLFGVGQGHFLTEVEFNLDISLTPVPDSRFDRGGNHLNIHAVASLGWPAARADALKDAQTIPNQKNNHIIPPDEQLLCYDQLYYGASVKAYEWYEDWVPMWIQVGRHLHWAPSMEQLARSYILRALKLTPSDSFPSYISVHIRRADFSALCKIKENPIENCYPPLSAYANKIAEVKQELHEKRGVVVDAVLVASDEVDLAWWKSVEDLGWNRIDWETEGTEALYSKWYPIILDSIALSLGKGFVGTKRSTLSLLAAKRVIDWENGFVREISLAS